MQYLDAGMVDEKQQHDAGFLKKLGVYSQGDQAGYDWFGKFTPESLCFPSVLTECSIVRPQGWCKSQEIDHYDNGFASGLTPQGCQKKGGFTPFPLPRSPRTEKIRRKNRPKNNFSKTAPPRLAGNSLRELTDFPSMAGKSWCHSVPRSPETPEFKVFDEEAEGARERHASHIGRQTQYFMHKTMRKNSKQKRSKQKHKGTVHRIPVLPVTPRFHRVQIERCRDETYASEHWVQPSRIGKPA
jgi:hypothetical protein